MFPVLSRVIRFNDSAIKRDGRDGRSLFFALRPLWECAAMGVCALSPSGIVYRVLITVYRVFPNITYIRQRVILWLIL